MLPLAPTPKAAEAMLRNAPAGAALVLHARQAGHKAQRRDRKRLPPGAEHINVIGLLARMEERLFDKAQEVLTMMKVTKQHLDHYGCANTAG